MAQNNLRRADKAPLDRVPLQRGQYFAPKKKRSYVSLIIQIIVLILTIISIYSMLKEPIFNILLVNEPIRFSQILNFQETLHNISSQNIDLTQLSHLQENISKLKLAFYAFFFAGILSLILTVLTLIFNRTAIKIVNMILIAIMFAIPFGLTYIVEETAKRVSETLQQYFINLAPDKILVTGEALSNATVLLACCFGLLFISLFFRNRRVRIK